MHYLDQLKEVFGALGHFLDIKLALSLILTLASFLFGVDMQTAMISLVVLMVFDLIMGTTAACMKTGEGLSSRKAAKTPLKFGVYLLLVSAAHLTDSAIFNGLYIQETMIAFLALTELISILENAGRMGIAVPQKLMDKLKEVREKQ